MSKSKLISLLSGEKKTETLQMLIFNKIIKCLLNYITSIFNNFFSFFLLFKIYGKYAYKLPISFSHAPKRIQCFSLLLSVLQLTVKHMYLHMQMPSGTFTHTLSVLIN